MTPAVLSGSTHVEIIRHSRRVGAELIVLGRHGRRTVRDKLIGSTATRIVRKGDVPVLVVNLEPAQPYRRPMVAAALEDADGRTIEVALRVLGREVRAIDVVHAVHVPFEGLVSPMPAAREQGGYRSELERKAEEGVAALIEAHARAGIRWNATVRVGDPSEVILTEALVRGTDLIALGTHGRTGIAHVLIGSVAESILTAAPCDLLVSRPIRFSFEQP